MASRCNVPGVGRLAPAWLILAGLMALVLLASPAALAQAAPPAALADWVKQVKAHFTAHVRFPPGGTAGDVRLLFVVASAGQLDGGVVIESSGSKLLDDEARAIARRAAPYPVPPPGAGKVSFTILVRFKPGPPPATGGKPAQGRRP